MASPGAKNLLPRDARGDAIGGENRLDRLAAAGLQDAELGDAPQLLLCRGASLAGGGEKQVEAGGTGADDGFTLRWHAGRCVPANKGHDRPGHVVDYTFKANRSAVFLHEVQDPAPGVVARVLPLCVPAVEKAMRRALVD